MKSASHSLLNSLDVMCVLCIICYRMQEGWAHVCPFIMWCHEKKKLCSLAAVKAEKRQKERAWFIPVDILVPCNYCTVSAAMSQPPISQGFAFRDGWLAGMGGGWIVSTHSVMKRHPPSCQKKHSLLAFSLQQQQQLTFLIFLGWSSLSWKKSSSSSYVCFWFV